MNYNNLSFDQIMQYILIGVYDQVAEKECKLRLIKVYNKIDAKLTRTRNSKHRSFCSATLFGSCSKVWPTCIMPVVKSICDGCAVAAMMWFSSFKNRTKNSISSYKTTTYVVGPFKF